MKTPTATLLFLAFCAAVCISSTTANRRFRLVKRDKSPNPASKSFSGCRLNTTSLCAGSHSDDDIQMGECWSNARVMGQKTAVFEPFAPGHKSYDSEGGPYGTCTAYPCYPSDSQMEQTDNLANLCFFWDGTDNTISGVKSVSTKKRDGGDSGGEDEKIEIKDKSNDGKEADDAADEKSEDKDTSTAEIESSTSGSTPDSLSVSSSSGKPPSSDSKGTSSSGNPTGSSTTASGGTMPNAPGEAVIPIPMVCPSNLGGCYSASYFESGGKLAAYADAKPTYKGIWFPPKGKDHQPLFCEGLGLGCPTPSMRDLQTEHLATVGCDVSLCSGGSGGSSNGTDSDASSSVSKTSTDKDDENEKSAELALRDVKDKAAGGWINQQPPSK